MKRLLCVGMMPVILVIFIGGCATSRLTNKNNAAEPIKIGYFYGGRVHLIYRSYINNLFDKEGINVELYTKYLYQEGWVKVPKDSDEVGRLVGETNVPGRKVFARLYGRATGIEIIEGMERGLFVGGTVGESSFIYEVVKGAPIVAVAMLGHDSEEMAGKVLAVRKDVVIKSPQDFKGKRIISRRAGPGDATFVKEFFAKNGLDPEKDVTIIDQVPLDKVESYFAKKQAEAVFLHINGAPKIVKTGQVYLYRGMDWLNPKLSQALLVFRKDFLETHPDEVTKFIRAYMKRIKYEASLPKEEQFKEAVFGLQIKFHFEKFSIPVWDYPPYVDTDILNEMQKLLLKYKEIDKEANLSEFINNEFVKKISDELK